MKKSSNRIREEIARLQEVLKAAETREAERIGRIALKAGLGEIAIEESTLAEAFEEIVRRFRTSQPRRSPDQGSNEADGSHRKTAQIAAGAAQSQSDEA